MTTQLSWLHEGVVLEGAVSKHIGMHETSQLSQEVTRFFGQLRGRQLHLLLDISELELTPVNATIFSTILLPLFIDPNCGWVLLYGTDKAASDIFETPATRMNRYRLHASPTREAALDFLMKKVPSLQRSA